MKNFITRSKQKKKIRNKENSIEAFEWPKILIFLKFSITSSKYTGKDLHSCEILVKLIFYELTFMQGVTKQNGRPIAKVEEYALGMISGSGSTLFEELGLDYIGPVDGHSIDDLVAILKQVKSPKKTGPVLIHVVTEKGLGYSYAEKAADKYHGTTGITILLLPFINMIHLLLFIQP